MPPRSKVISRNQPDTLYKLCIRHRALLEKAINSGFAGKKNSLQARLIQYYLTLGGSWERDKEKSDWAGSDFKSLKYETYRLVIRILTQVAEWDNREMYAKISEIEFAIENHGYGYALDIAEVILPKAIENEEFGLAVQIIDLQGQAYDHIADRMHISSLVEANNKKRIETMRLLHELQHSQEFRRMVVEPIKRDWEKNEQIAGTKIEALRAGLESLRSLELSSQKAIIEYLSAASMFCLLTKEIAEGYKHLGKLIDLYRNSNLLRRNRPRYIQHLRAYAMLSAQLGYEEIARSCLASLWDMYLENQETHLHALHSWIRVAIRISYHCKDQNLATEAIGLFELHKNEIKMVAQESEWVRLNWWAMISLAENGHHEHAYRIGLLLLAKKTLVKENWLICIRILILALTISMFSNDADRINDTYRACYEYLRRQRQAYPEAIGVLREFWEMWKCWSNGNEITPIPQPPLNPTRSGGEGSYDFHPIYMQILFLLKDHR